MTDVIVIGGGISGLTAAWKLRQQNKKVLILEEQTHTGGNIKSFTENGFILEHGPHSFMGSSEFVWKLVKELGFSGAIEPATPASGNRYIYRNEKLAALPGSLSTFIFSKALSPMGKIRLMMEPFIRNGATDNETAWDFFCRRFGKEAATYIMTPFISGVYAGDIHQLGAKEAFSKFWNFEKESGSMIRGAFKYMKEKKKRLQREGVERKKGMFSTKKGLGGFTEELSEQLKNFIKTDVQVTEIDTNNGYVSVRSSESQWKAPSVIIAAPPHKASGILRKKFPAASNFFLKIPMSPVVLIHWSIDRENHHIPNGFGFLMPKIFDLKVLGTLFMTKIYPRRSPESSQLMSSFYGGMLDPAAIDRDDSQLVDLHLSEQKKIFGAELENTKILKILRYPYGIPQLIPGHTELIQNIREQLNQYPGIILAGNYLTGVGIEHSVESGYNAATECLQFLHNKPGNKHGQKK